MIKSFNVYLGVGFVWAIDWRNPIASFPADAEPMIASVQLSVGVNYYLAARAVDEFGVEENNSHIFAGIRLGETGQVMPIVSAPRNVQAKVASGDVMVSFELEFSPGRELPDHVEIFFRDSHGNVDWDSPVAIVDAIEPSRRVYFVRVSMPAGDGWFVARGVVDGYLSLLSESSRFVPPAIPVSPIAAEV